MNVGKSIKIALINNDKTQTWLAEKLGVTKQQVSHWCNHPTTSSGTLNTISKLLGYSVSEFIALGEAKNNSLDLKKEQE